MVIYNMKSFLIITVIFILIGSCFPRINMRNDPPPPPKAWYRFPVSGFQLKDMIDSLIDKDPGLMYDLFQKAHGNPYFGIFMPAGKDTIRYVVIIYGNYRDWIKQGDSSYLALMDITKGKLSPNSFTSVIVTDTLTKDEHKKHFDHFSTQVIPQLRNIIAETPRYIIRPLNLKDTLEAQWIFCKGKMNLQCDTLWLTSKNGAEYILADSSIFVPFNYRN